jgi:hypothetical protein
MPNKNQDPYNNHRNKLIQFIIELYIYTSIYIYILLLRLTHNEYTKMILFKNQ